MKITNNRQRLSNLHLMLDQQLSSQTQSIANSCQQSLLGKSYKAYDTQSNNSQRRMSSRKQQINDLQKKLLQLEKKMDTIDNPLGSKRNSTKQLSQKSLKEKLIINEQDFQRKYSKKNLAQSSQQQDQTDYFIVKQRQSLIPIQNKQSKKQKQNNQNQKNARSYSVNKMSNLGDKKSIMSNSSIKDRKSSAKRSVNGSALKSSNRISSNNKRKAINLSNDNISIRGNEHLKQNIKIKNLQKQITHYKNLTDNLKEKLKGMQKLQIEYRKLKQNFDKSQQIRKQQKKIIENFKIKN